VEVVKLDSAGIQINDKCGWWQGVIENVLEKRKMKVALRDGLIVQIRSRYHNGNSPRY
jgi:hypothetical protein